MITIEKANIWHNVRFPGEPCSELEALMTMFSYPEDAKRAGCYYDRPAMFWRICEILWPRTETSKVVVEPNPWAERMIIAACKHKLLGASGCSSSGKSFVLGAAWGLVNWFCDQGNTKVLISSTSLQGARNRVWKDTMQLFQGAMGIGMSNMNPSLKPTDSQMRIGLDAKALRKLDPDFKMDVIAGTGIEIVAGSASDEKEACEKIQGIKAKRIILILDEMPYLGHSLLGTFIGNLSANKDAQCIGLGNFGSAYDAFGEFTEPLDGWKSVHEGLDGWVTKPHNQRGYCLRFDGEKSPNVLAGREVYPGLYSLEANRVHQNMGRSSKFYWTFCRSMPSPEGDDTSIYSEADLFAGEVHDNCLWDADPTPVSFIDPGFTNGGDESIQRIGHYGTVNGMQTLKYVARYPIVADVSSKVDRNFQVARKFRENCEAHRVEPRNAGFDSTGGGLSWGSIVYNEWSTEVAAICFGGSASDRPVSVANPVIGSEWYQDKVSEIWVQGKEFVRSNQIKGMDREMAEQLLQRRYPDTEKTRRTAKKVRIESKREMKSRIGHSPDDADSGLGLIELCRERLGFTPNGFGAASEESKDAWQEMVRHSDAIASDEHLAEPSY